MSTGIQKKDVENAIFDQNKRNFEYYPVDDVKWTQPEKKKKIPKLRSSLKKGAIVIILSGPFSGKRAVLLNVLPSTGHVVVTGPSSINEVPLHPIDPAFLIVTSTQIDITNIDFSKFNEDYFKIEKTVCEKTDEEDIFFLNKEEEERSMKEKSLSADQKYVDEECSKIISKVEYLQEYLAESFFLKKRQYPHLMKF